MRIAVNAASDRQFRKWNEPSVVAAFGCLCPSANGICQAQWPLFRPWPELDESAFVSKVLEHHRGRKCKARCSPRRTPVANRERKPRRLLLDTPRTTHKQIKA
jgi:hypothetical protein